MVNITPPSRQGQAGALIEICDVTSRTTILLFVKDLKEVLFHDTNG
jgi:hypothetical protein